jgi:hypothetical protein
MNVGGTDWAIFWDCANTIRATDDATALDAPTRQDNAVTLRPMVSARLGVDLRSSAKVAHPNHQRTIK